MAALLLVRPSGRTDSLQEEVQWCKALREQ